MGFELFDYQKTYIDGSANALFSEAGTGKSYMSLGRFLKSDATKLLIIGLAGKVGEWEEDILYLEEHMGSDKITVDEIGIVKKGMTPARRKKLVENPKIKMISVSYESAWRTPELVKWVDENTMIILDEGHKIANPTSKQSKFILKLGKQTKLKQVLTGTPFTSQGYASIFSQYKFLDIVEWSPWTFRKWKDTFAIETEFDAGGFPIKKITGYKNTKQLDHVVNKYAFWKKRDKSYSPTFRIHSFPMAKNDPYKKLKKDKIYEAQDGELFMYDTVGAMYAAERRASFGLYGTKDYLNTERADYVKEVLETLPERVVVFYNFNAELAILKDLMKSINRPFGEYNGHKKDLTNFKENDNGVALVNYGSGATGLNDFIISNNMIMFSLPMGQYVTYTQAIARIDRVGQTKAPNYWILLKDNTVEVPILKAIQDGKNFDKSMYESWLSGDYAEVNGNKKHDGRLKTQYLPDTKRIDGLSGKA